VLEFNRLFGNQGLGQGSDLKDAILDYLQRQSRPHDPDGHRANAAVASSGVTQNTVP
jgi:hypothetical protein